MELSQIVVDSLIFLFGLIAGNWMAIGRDIRKEFNDAAAPVRSWILSEVDSPSPYTKRPTEIEFDRFASYLRPWRRSSFQAGLNRQSSLRDANRVADRYGSVSYKEEDGIKNELRALLKYTARR